MEVEEIVIKDPIKIVRVIFKDFPTCKEIFSKKYTLKSSISILLTKLFTTPLFYDGFVYDHSELLTPKRQRFGIRKDPFGVYLINKNGFWDAKNQELLDQRYKLVFAFQINKKQEEKLYNFIEKHKSEQYNSKIVNLNYILRKLNIEKLMIDSYNRKGNTKWDCVMLIMRALFEIEVIPEFLKNGKKVPLLGLSTHNMAMLLLEMYKNGELSHCIYVISKELQKLSEYKKKLKLFYVKGCKITRE